MLRVIESKNKPISEHATLAEQLEQVIKKNNVLPTFGIVRY